MMTAARRTTATGARTVQLGPWVLLITVLAVVVTFFTASAMTVFGIGFGAAVLLAGRVAAALAGAAGLALVGDLVRGLAGDLVLGLAGGDDFGGDLRGERRVDTDRTMAMWFGRFPGKRGMSLHGCRYTSYLLPRKYRVLQVEVITHSDSHCHWAVRAKL